MKKTIRILGATVSLILMLSLSSCYYDEVLEDLTPPNNDVSFANDIQPIFTASCASCHPNVAPPDLTLGSSYNSITNGIYIVPNDLDASLLYQRMIGNGNIMPPDGALPNATIALIEDWINQGALDN